MAVVLFVVSLHVRVIGSTAAEGDAKAAGEFIHPGILNSAEELILMKQNAAGSNACEPWKSSYEELLELVATYYDTSSANYINFGELTTTAITHFNSGGGNDMRLAASKAYNLAIAYYISENSQYAQTAREIMMHYANQFQGLGSLTDGYGLYDCEVISGVIALKFCSAAEILTFSNYSGWSEADTQALVDMFQRNSGTDTICSMSRLFDWTNDSDGLMSRYDMNNVVHGHASFANFGALAYAVLAEDRDLFNRTVANVCADVSPEYIPATYSWERKPVVTSTGGALTYIINPVTGQNKEIDRDITHSTVLISALTTIAEIAYHQGDTAVYESHDRLLLKGIDYMARYNLGYEVPYTSVYPWNHHNDAMSTDNRGGAVREVPMYEAAYNYYRYHSNADSSGYAYLEQLVNTQSLSPEEISEDVSGMGTLLYSDIDRKNVYAVLGTKEKNPAHEILAKNYMALIQNADITSDGKITVSGGDKGVITYKTPAWDADGQATTELGIQISSNTTGYVEFRLQSKNGKYFNQNILSVGTAGNTGSLLARIDIPDTNGETVKLKGTVYDINGNLGGNLITSEHPEMLYVVVYSNEADGTISYSNITVRPNSEYVLSNGEITYLPRPEPSGMELVDSSDFETLTYGWNGSGLGLSGLALDDLFDGEINSAITDANGERVLSDVYLIVDLKKDIPIEMIELGLYDENAYSGGWAIYGSDLDTVSFGETDWKLLGVPQDFTVDDWNVMSLQLSGEKYRYLMIGGRDTFLGSWVHSWDKMSEIMIYTEQDSLSTPTGMKRIAEADMQLYQYGWTGAGVDFMECSLTGLHDNDLTTPLEDGNQQSKYGIDDRYLVFDLGTETSVGAVKMASLNTEVLSGSWAVYGSNRMDSQQSSWDVIMLSSEMQLVDGVIEVPVNGSYRYIMIGGYSEGNYMDAWVHSWDYMTEIGIYKVW